MKNRAHNTKKLVQVRSILLEALVLCQDQIAIAVRGKPSQKKITKSKSTIVLQFLSQAETNLKNIKE